MNPAREVKVTSNLKLAAWRPYPLLLMDIEAVLLSTGGGAGMEKMKNKEARKNDNIGKSVDSFFSFWLVFNRLHFPWFFIVFIIPIYFFLSSFVLKF